MTVFDNHYSKRFLEVLILETMTLDSRTLIIKSDNDDDLPEIIDAINQKSKTNNINSFLEFASKNRITRNDYKFNREDCYGR
jgi:hypothetical protein